MHASAYAHMARCIERYLPRDRHYRVVDVGSRRVRRQPRTHRDLLRDHDHAYLGVDVAPGPNVDAVMARPYRIPVATSSVDVVLSGQTFEHIPFPWASMLEIARILKPGGYVFLTAPSRGHVHAGHAGDCWRYYPGGLLALAAFAGLDVIEAHTDFPPLTSWGRHDYSAIDSDLAYWGDTVGVLRKPSDRSFWPIAPLREAVIWWANRQGEIDPGRRGGRRRSTAARDDGQGVERGRTGYVSSMSWRGGVNALLRRTTGYVLATPAHGERRAPTRRGRRRPAGEKNAPGPDCDAAARETIRAVRKRTTMSAEKLFGLISAVRYVVRHDIPGAIVECGVWRGGSTQAIARTLRELGVFDRELRVFDAFDGAPPPGEGSGSIEGGDSDRSARPELVPASLADVEAAIAEVGYPPERVHYVEGRIEETIPGSTPDGIAILRLATEWYESTRQALKYLYPRLASGGVLFVDDYWWHGTQKAVDQFLEETGERLLLLPVDRGRIAVKP